MDSYASLTLTQTVTGLDGMDSYASLIRAQQDTLRLNRLAHELLSVSTDRAEAWVAAALHCELKGEPIVGAYN